MPGNDGPQVRQLLDTGVFHLINLVYTLINPSAGMPVPPGLEVDADFGNVISYAQSKGVGTAVYSPLAGGQLTDHMLGGGEPHPLSGAARGERRRLQQNNGEAFRFLSGHHTLVRPRPVHPDEPRRYHRPRRLFGHRPTRQGVAAVDVEPLDPELMAQVETALRANLGREPSVAPA